ncbi:hypothetical protein LSAT2_019712 [Lamellibrachia satsuma]|nr:hypothetical protein LSAT2_019712 [Lamellibrachia satsuma]
MENATEDVDYWTNATSWLDGEPTQFEAFVNWMDRCFVPTLLLVGLVGNSLSFIVFMSRRLRRFSCSVYLAALAVSDNGLLLCVFVSWAPRIGLDLLQRPGWCEAFVYLTYVFSFLSVWYIVIFTAERYVAVCLPLHRRRICTARRARTVVAAVALFAALAYTFATWTSAPVLLPDAHTRYCMPLPRFFDLVTTLNSVDTVVTLVVPWLLIVVLNVRIVYVVRRMRKWRVRKDNFQNVSRQSSRTESAGSLHSEPEVGLRRSQLKVTKLLIVVSTLFIVINLPSHAVRVYSFVISFVSDTYRPSIAFINCQALLQYLYYTNFCVNFFLYSACGGNFRHALVHIFTGFFSRSCRLPRLRQYCGFGNGLQQMSRSYHGQRECVL